MATDRILYDLYQKLESLIEKKSLSSELAVSQSDLQGKYEEVLDNLSSKYGHFHSWREILKIEEYLFIEVRRKSHELALSLILNKY